MLSICSIVTIAAFLIGEIATRVFGIQKAFLYLILLCRFTALIFLLYGDIQQKFNSFIDVVNYHLHLALLNIETDKNKLCQMVEKMLQEYPNNVYYHSIASTENLLELLQKKDSTFTPFYKKLQRKINDLNKEFGYTKP